MPHPFTGRLIDGGQAADWLGAGLAGSSSNVSLCSAYLRSRALETLLAARGANLHGRVLVRWQLADLLTGASDLRAFEVAKAAGFKFWIRLDFHGKVFCVPTCGILVGSANATLSGLGLHAHSNEEVCTLVQPTPENMAHIDRLFAGAVLLDDQLVAEIGEAVGAESLLQRPTGSMEWPESLLDKLTVYLPVESLFASECLKSNPRLGLDGLIALDDPHDRRLLGLSQGAVESGHALYKLKQTKVFRWLTQHLKRCGGEQYFGALAASMHDTILDDPTPIRYEVKTLLQALLSWCSLLPAAGVIVDRPHYSQRVRLSGSSVPPTSGLTAPRSGESGRSRRPVRRPRGYKDRSG